MAPGENRTQATLVEGEHSHHCAMFDTFLLGSIQFLQPSLSCFVNIFRFCTVLEYCDGNDLDFLLKQHKTVPEREVSLLPL